MKNTLLCTILVQCIGVLFMSGNSNNGVFQNAKGQWGYRFSLLIDGKRITRRKFTDENGIKLTSKRAAEKAREAAINQAHTEMKRTEKVVRRTMADVFKEYSENGRFGKAYQTIRKQDSLWENHINPRFGKRFVDSISVAEVSDFLSELYYIDGYSFQYTESFLKMFYLIFGQAYSRNYLDVDTYNKMCVNKNTKIKMPKIKSEDDTEIVAFSRQELSALDDYFKGTNAETAYLLGRYCGLRINECYGLKWDNVDVDAGTIIIDRQMQYQNGLIKLVSPKTHNSKRTLYMCGALKTHFQALAAERQRYETEFAALREQNKRMIEDLDGKKIPSTALVNCLYDGKIQTVNSMKYPTREIKSKLGINFKYHYLRHTYGTLMAEMNTPTHLLCNQMGHGNIQVTQRYYIAVSKTGIDVLRNNIENL